MACSASGRWRSATAKAALFNDTITPSQIVTSANSAYGAGVWASGGVSEGCAKVFERLAYKIFGIVGNEPKLWWLAKKIGWLSQPFHHYVQEPPLDPARSWTQSRALPKMVPTKPAASRST